MRPSEPDLPLACVLISCAERADICRQTLAHLAVTDWRERPVHVQQDRKLTSDRLQNIVDTGYLALAYGLRTKAPWLLFLEDDLIFNNHLWQNIAAWWPLKNGHITLASLYNPGVRSVFAAPQDNFFEAHPHYTYGSQALLLTHGTIEYLVAHWDEVIAPLDIRVFRLAARLQRPLYYHVPSLVQHVGNQSLWGGKFHGAVDFDPGWQAMEHT